MNYGTKSRMSFVITVTTPIDEQTTGNRQDKSPCNDISCMVSGNTELPALIIIYIPGNCFINEQA